MLKLIYNTYINRLHKKDGCKIIKLSTTEQVSYIIISELYNYSPYASFNIKLATAGI